MFIGNGLKEFLIVRFDVFYLAAGIIAILAMLVPFVGRIVLKTPIFSLPADGSPHIRSGRLSSLLVARHVVLSVSTVMGVILVLLWASWADSPADTWMALTALGLAIVLGFIRDEFRMPLRTKVAVQLALAVVPPFLFEITLPITLNTNLLVDQILTVVFIFGVLNALVIVNILDGFSSLLIFVTAACLAVMFGPMSGPFAATFSNLSGGGPGTGDAIGVIFSLTVCGGGLAFFLTQRPSARERHGDYGTLLLGFVSSLLVIRAWQTWGDRSPNPAVFVPLTLLLPILWAAIYRERMALYRRERYALLIVMAGHIPAWIPVALSQQHVLAHAILAIGSTIAWAAFVTQGRAIRGWSMRVMSEPIADILRIAVGMSFVYLGVAAYLVFSDELLNFEVLSVGSMIPIGASLTLTTALLVIQVTWWRRRVQDHKISDVVIFGSRLDSSNAMRVFRNCGDLFGQSKMRRSEVGLASKHLREVVAEHLREGHTVLILSDRARARLIGLRSLGDLVFASDTLLLRHSGEDQSVLDRRSAFMDRLQDYSHRVVAVIGLVVLAPMILAVMALVKLDDGGPVFFCQDRIGRGGRHFTVYKIRSMRVDAPLYGESPRADGDRRITRIGRVIRRLSLDELPQLVNVIRGEMRLVGPRPEMPFICEQYDDHERKRLDVTPGITGLWQVSPHRNDPIHHHVEYDLAYQHAQGPILDAAIVIATILGGVKNGM
ncbi:MAG: hypothetical protein D8M59_06315 [Planctomycetes bacterium]|nr:hypothetical protein [Planctomycetota bacterium]